ncbi:MAG: AraC family transcriptional regulator [Verrucomicrobiota bacterium]
MVRPKTAQEQFLDQLRPGQMLEALFDSLPNANFFVKDRESRFMSASRSFAQMLGEDSVEALLGKTDFDYSADFLAEAFIADDQKVLREGQPILSKVELVPDVDSLEWVCTSKIPLFGLDNEVIGLAGIVQHLEDGHELYLHHAEMRKIVEFIQHNYRSKVTLSQMAEVAGISVSSVERLFRRNFGLTPYRYLQKTRLNAACRYLRSDQVELAQISTRCGFSDQTSMTRSFRQELKITPLKYRQRFSAKSLNGNEKTKIL